MNYVKHTTQSSIFIQERNLSYVSHNGFLQMCLCRSQIVKMKINGFSPVWILICCSLLLACANDFVNSLEVIYFSLMWEMLLMWWKATWIQWRMMLISSVLTRANSSMMHKTTPYICQKIYLMPKIMKIISESIQERSLINV